MLSNVAVPSAVGKMAYPPGIRNVMSAMACHSMAEESTELAKGYTTTVIPTGIERPSVVNHAGTLAGPDSYGQAGINRTSAQKTRTLVFRVARNRSLR